MPTLDVALDGLRSTLLAACGLSIVACTESPPRSPSPTSARVQHDPAPQPQPEPQPEPAKPKPEPYTYECEDPQPVMRNGVDTGYVRCLDGALNRARALSCAEPIRANACHGNETRRSCRTHADCNEKPNGFCMSGNGQAGSYCSCLYPCLSDSDCGPYQACMCPIVSGGRRYAATCAPADCKENADCSSGECGATYHYDGCRPQYELQCRGAKDTCHGPADCSESVDCSALDSKPFACTPSNCKIGRPLTVEDGVRVACVTNREWSAAARLRGLAPEPARAAHWLEVAQMEHASIASFARFVQELLRLGAPPQLLTDALVAAADEVRHAEQSFALASAYAGAPLGPGPLRVDDLSSTTSLELFVTRLIVEGCVGETLGVAEALALLEQELDPLLRPQLERIAVDETRHAALAWRTLRWISRHTDPAVIERAFECAIEQAAHVDDEAMDPAHGRLGARAKQHVRARALAEIVEPCRRQLQWG